MLDTNILLDVLVARKPFYIDSAAVWSLAEDRTLEGLVSAITFTNIFYIVRKQSNANHARLVLAKLHNVFSVVDCDARTIARAITSSIKDFEDAVQYFSALQAAADCLLTRNPIDFPRGRDCPVLTPAEFLASNSFE